MGKVRQFRSGPRKTWWKLTVALLLMLTFFTLILRSIPNEDTSFGLSKPNHLNSIARNTRISEGGDHHSEERWVEIMSWEPRAFLYHNFLTKEECEHLINIAKPDMKKSKVVKEESGKTELSSERTSSGAFLARGRDEIVTNIERRIADFTFIPVEHGEDLQVLHYEVGQKYVPHHDFFTDKLNADITIGGQRAATMLMYLSDVEEGGETVFPDAKGNFSSVPWWNEVSECGKQGLSIKPKMGDALLFWSLNPDATYDQASLHG
ncbi:hypothetical protein Fmac_015063 [Flemingia macrophylla]|uniref:procollagen-proline 4-dioxygenase n=1 Tax=Flemingia macrophylla TaxID=520843 RepID=A0ABD1MDH5_9FABA